MSKYHRMPEEYLRKIYVPDVYQKSIYDIDYIKLKQKGIKVISFDMDDTIDSMVEIRKPGYKVPKEAVILFQYLKSEGFKCVIISNANDDLVKSFSNDLGVDWYISRAEKPKMQHFLRIMEKYNITEEQMAHVGNSIVNDIAGARTAHPEHNSAENDNPQSAQITACLVKNVGKAVGAGRKVGKLFGYQTEASKLREALTDRDIWRKHHLYEKGDQYYQLGETPLYRR